MTTRGRDETCERVLSLLERLGTSIASQDLPRLVLYLLWNVVEEVSIGNVWVRRGPGDYKFAASTLAGPDYEAARASIDRAFQSAHPAGWSRAAHSLKSKGAPRSTSAPLPGPLKCQTTYGAEHVGMHLLVLSLERSELVFEAYLTEPPGDGFVQLAERLDEIAFKLISRHREISEFLSTRGRELRRATAERTLFRQIYRDLKTWFGEELQAVNIFRFNPRDRMLYHLDTSHLQLQDETVAEYEPVPEISDEEKIAYIKENLSEQYAGDTQLLATLDQLMIQLRDRDATRAGVDETNLQLLLQALPQEPGTGVAGETAVTLMPQIGADPNDPRWKTATYKDAFFAIMLSVEKLFGIAALGNRMAAVPLFESGQFWGVMFVVHKQGLERQRLLDFWERSQYVSSFLSIYQSFRFQQLVTREARYKPFESVAEIALANIHHALNPILAVLWQLRRDHSVTSWGFRPRHRRFGPIDRSTGKKGFWKNPSVRTAVHRCASGQLEIREVDPQEPYAALLPSLKVPNVEWVERARSVVIIPAPENELLVVYTNDDPEALRRFRGNLEDRFACIWDVHEVREGAVLFPDIVYESAQMAKLVARVKQIGGNNDYRNILIIGETGVGKELIASALHRSSPRSSGPFEKMNCAALPPTLIDAALFGSEKGAYTDANERPGFFGNADGGTLFLDEIGALPIEFQSKLMRVLEQGTIQRVGAGTEIPVDVRVVAATNEPLAEMVQRGDFRKDLAGRFDYTLKIPPLRERIVDVIALAYHFAAGSRITTRAIARLLNYDWKLGNVRELQKVIKNAKDLDAREHGVINEEDLRDMEIEKFGDPLPHPLDNVETRDVTRHLAASQRLRDVHALFSNATYDTNDAPEDDWIFHLAHALQALAERQPAIRSFCSVGCGAGLDAVAAGIHLGARRFCLTDVNPDVLAIAKANVRSILPFATDLSTPEITTCAGDLFEGVASGSAFDLIYENLPNIPHEGAAPLGGRGFATFYEGASAGEGEAARLLLGLHARFLSDAQKWLVGGGAVLCAIGARVPWGAIETMFRASGYEPDLVWVSVKAQQQPEEVLPAYARWEQKSGITFKFLRLDAVRVNLPPNRRVSRGQVEGWLADANVSMSAEEAFEEHGRGTRIAHGVYYVLGRRKLSPE